MNTRKDNFNEDAGEAGNSEIEESSQPLQASPEDAHYKVKVLRPLLLFLVTVVTTVLTGAAFEGVDIIADPKGILKGIPFSFSLIVILGTHEFGHFIASRVHKVRATLPFFIPAPPVPPFIGTFGAVIKLKSPITNKRALIDIGAAGPLAGFVVAVIVIIVGLKLSRVLPFMPPPGTLEFGLPIIFKILTYLTIGGIPEGHTLVYHAVLFAGWIGLFITSLNLLPMGQLDGGHILYALIGPYHRVVSLVLATILIVLGFFSWPGWSLWGTLVLIIGI
ncbi:MAG: site-2 protease family protein, partial [Deltaproteobacteria bacterium]|nr:site-2 protease family protein [Deltaproteobacteria bacterium]